MWSRIEGVAGKVRTNVSQLAKDVLEGGEDDSPQQGSNLSTFSTGVQQSTMPQSLHGQYTPYSQAAGVHAAQQAAPWPVQANPVAHQHRPLQQIPFMPQRSLNTQQAPKPQLFVPQPVQAQRIVHEVDQDAHAHVTIAKASEPAAQGGTQASTTRPAVSTRLSALKAKLDQDKHRSAEEKAPTRQPQHKVLGTSNTSTAEKASSKASAQPARPQIPFLSHNQTQPQAHPQASQHREQRQTTESAPSTQQLQDFGFEEVDLDSPDLPLSMATPEKSSQAVNHGPLPIPFMQTAHQSQSVPPTSRTIDQSQANPWSDSDHISQPAMTDSPPASPLFQPNELTDLSLHSGAESSYTSPAKALSEHPSASSDAVQAQANISAFAQVPFSMPGTGLEGFSTHSGPPSIASSALSSPGVAPNGIIPSRRSSFLPRGMSSHLHKALRATAAAASKASAAIAPPPSSVQAASPELWQSQTDAQSGLAAAPSHQLSEHSTDEVHAARGLWEPDGHGAVEQLGKDTPWWQKQLRSLQHNLQSPESEDGSLPESDAFLGIADDGTQHQQPQISSQQHQEASSNGDVSYVNADQQHPSSSPVHSHIQLPGADAFPSAVKHTDSVYDKAALWQQQLSNGCHSDSVDLDRQAQAATQDKSEAEPQVTSQILPLLEAQQDADPSTASIRQPGSDLQQLPTAATASPSSAIQAAPVKVLNKHLQASSAKGSSLHDVPVNSTAHAAVITRSHNSLSSSGNAPQQTSPESDADGTDSQEGVTQDSTDLYNTVEQLRQDLAAVQQRLHASDAECTHLQAMLTAHDEATETSAQTHAKLEQHWRSQSQQHQQQLKQLQQQLAQQQEQSAQQATSSTGFRQELQSSQQQVQSLQSQLAEQQNQLELAESAVKDLELQLHASQAQCDNAVAELGRFQRDMHTMKQQLAEQQQAQDNSQRMQQSMQAELNQSQAERDLLQQQLSTAQQQAAASEQSLHDRDTAWQEELQQQQSHKDKVQQELDELKVMYEQQQAEQHEVSQPQSPATSAHQQDELISQLTDQVQQARQDLAGQRARTMALQQALEDQGEEMESAQASAVASAAASEDLHSSLEAQLRSSQADIGWLQSEVGRLKAAAAAAADAHSLAALHASRVTEAKAGLEQQLQRSQAEVVSLHKEVEQLKVAAAYAKAPSGASDAEQTATRRQRQEASMSEQNGTQADEDALPGVAPADQSQPGLQTELQQKLQATELERDKAKQQVSRLKQQLMSEQEGEEEKVGWRVEAEVKLALQEALANQAQQGITNEEEVSRLRQEVAANAAQIQQMQQDLQAWEDAVTARDAELRNLQAALGELTFESEAAAGLRAELRAAQEQASSLQQQLQLSQQQVQEGRDAVRGAQQAAADASYGTQEQQKLERQLQDETAMLRRALKESMGRLATLSDEGNVQVDRRIVVKLLVTFFEKGQSKEVLQLMARILNFTDEDKAKVGLTGTRRGILGRVAGKLSLTSSDTKQDSDNSLADQWLDFLVRQAEAADAAEAAGKASVRSELPSSISRPVPSVQHNWNSTQSPLQSDVLQ